jgi:NADH:ubiquinone oxidoreductase subunit E
MPVQLMMCRLCARSRPEFLQAITQLIAAYPDQLVVEELECMAACDDVPAVMLETDYLPQVSPCDLTRLVTLRLAGLEPAAKL